MYGHTNALTNRWLTMEQSIKVGEDLKIRVLLALDKFGWLTAEQVGAVCFSHSKNPAVRARLKLRQLLRQGLVRGTSTSHATVAWQLTNATRLALEQAGLRVPRAIEYVNVHHVTEHTALATWIAIQKRGWNEYSLLTGQVPGLKSRLMGKIPDAVYWQGHDLIWVEVENSWKNKKSRQGVLNFCVAAFGKEVKNPIEIGDKILTMMEIVCATDESFKAIRRTIAANKSHFSEMRLSEMLVRVQKLRSGLNLADPGESLFAIDA